MYNQISQKYNRSSTYIKLVLQDKSQQLKLKKKSASINKIEKDIRFKQIVNYKQLLQLFVNEVNQLKDYLLNCQIKDRKFGQPKIQFSLQGEIQVYVRVQVESQGLLDAGSLVHKIIEALKISEISLPLQDLSKWHKNKVSAQLANKFKDELGQILGKVQKLDQKKLEEVKSQLQELNKKLQARKIQKQARKNEADKQKARDPK